MIQAPKIDQKAKVYSLYFENMEFDAIILPNFKQSLHVSVKIKI